MIPLTLVLRQTKAFYELKKRGKKINHLLFMDDLKLFAKNEDQTDNLAKTVRNQRTSKWSLGYQNVGC